MWVERVVYLWYQYEMFSFWGQYIYDLLQKSRHIVGSSAYMALLPAELHWPWAAGYMTVLSFTSVHTLKWNLASLLMKMWSFVLLYCWCENLLLKLLVVRCTSMREYAVHLLNIYYRDVGSRFAAVSVISCRYLQ